MFPLQMERWVEVKDRNVTFGNIVAAYVGKDYCYTCATAEDARAFGAYLRERDPSNKNMPTAVTDEVRKRYKAIQVKGQED